jgi:hypothetical protein
MPNATVWVHPVTGEVWTTGFAWNDATRPPDLSDDEFLAHAMTKLFRDLGLPSDLAYRIVPSEVVSAQDQYFRDCWEDINFTVNMTKARDLHMGEIRRVRNAELAKLDIPWMKAVEAGDTSAQAAIASEKQTLRDIPQTFDLSVYTTPESLKAAWPIELV